MKRWLPGILFLLLVTFGRVSDAGATVLFAGTSTINDGLSASASFTITGTTLKILLTNTDAATGSGRPNEYDEVLSGLFFNLGTTSFTPVSATIKTGEIVQEYNCDPPANCTSTQKNVGGEWSYNHGTVSWLTSSTIKPNQGIGSAAYLGGATSAGNFGTLNLQDPVGLDKIEFGIVPQGWGPEGGGDDYLDSNALIAGAVEYVLTVPLGLKESDISKVYFTYGKYKDDGDFKGDPKTTTTTGGSGSSVPEPASLGLLGLGFAIAGYRLRRSRA